jgi:hypothetical protein
MVSRFFSGAVKKEFFNTFLVTDNR